jgi:hypothetical protein
MFFTFERFFVIKVSKYDFIFLLDFLLWSHSEIFFLRTYKNWKNISEFCNFESILFIEQHKLI